MAYSPPNDRTNSLDALVRELTGAVSKLGAKNEKSEAKNEGRGVIWVLWGVVGCF